MTGVPGWALAPLLLTAMLALALPAAAAPSTPKSLLKTLDAGAKIVSLKKLAKNPLRYDGKPVLTTGFLVRDDTRFLLFPDVDDYESWDLEGAIAVLSLPDQATARWEKFERAYVHVGGTFVAPCGDRDKKSDRSNVTALPLGEPYGRPISVCESDGIAMPFIDQVEVAQSDGQRSVELKPGHPQYWSAFEWKGLFWNDRGALADVANGFFRAVKQRDFDGMMSYFGPRAPNQLRRDLANPRSVISERLYDGESSISDVLSITNITGLKIGIDNQEWSRSTPYAFACLCKKMICLGDWKPPRFGTVTDADPISCVGLEKSAERWHVDFYPFLTPGMTYEGLAW